MTGIKHLIECHCILQQYKKRADPLYHKFTVYSKIKDDKVELKYAQCNNCGIVHKVYDICRSEIVTGKEDHNVGLTIEEMSIQLSDKLSNLLSVNNCDYATWEHVLDIIESSRWNESVVIKREIIDSKENIKILSILSEEKVKITSRSIEDEIIGERIL
jgi:hypothetical protein